MRDLFGLGIIALFVGAIAMALAYFLSDLIGISADALFIGFSAILGASLVAISIEDGSKSTNTQ